MTQKPLLSAENLSVSYGVIRAVRDFSFHVNEGEIVTILGSNGAGKSSTLNAIMGFAPIISGGVRFNGAEITDRSTEQIVGAGLTLTPEGRRVFPDLTVYENLLLGSYVTRGKGLNGSLAEMFDLFPVLAERRQQLAGTLSGGEQQMLAIARSLMSQPKLLMLDEPSLGLAPIIVAEVFKLIGRLRERGTTILLIEQNVAQSLDIADRAYLLELGALVREGAADEFAEEAEIEQMYLGG